MNGNPCEAMVMVGGGLLETAPCARRDPDKPMCFRGEPWCCDNHKKLILAADVDNEVRECGYCQQEVLYVKRHGWLPAKPGGDGVGGYYGCTANRVPGAHVPKSVDGTGNSVAKGITGA